MRQRSFASVICTAIWRVNAFWKLDAALDGRLNEFGLNKFSNPTFPAKLWKENDELEKEALESEYWN